MALTQTGTDGIKDDAVTTDKLANAINTARDANTAKTTNATHTGEVTGATALTITDDVVDEANLKISNAGSNGQFLQKQSGNTGGLTWADASASPDWQSFQAEMVGDQSITNHTWTKVRFNAQNWDTNDNYDHTDNDWCFEAPAAGKYWYKVSLLCKDLAENGTLRVALYKDSGSGYVEQKKTLRINYQPNAANKDMTVETTGLISLAANDKIAVYGYHNHNAARDFDDNYCLFSMFKLDGA